MAIVTVIIKIGYNRRNEVTQLEESELNLKANAGRILEELNILKTFNSQPEQQGITRMLFSDAELQARAYIIKLMTDAGLTVTEDAIGNIFACMVGLEPDLPPVWSGSHIDTVINAGMYDGTVGVIGALEACRMIREAGIPHRRNILTAVFASEEPTRFGMGCIGSRALAGHLTLDETKNVADQNGVSLYAELERLGYTKKDFSTVKKQNGDVFASVELHIEQAPVLEQLGCPIGVVEGICAPTYIQVILEGEQKHAGSTPMNARRDVVPAASEIILQLESLARTYGNTHTVATVGKVDIYPNAPNVIAGHGSFTIDIRDVDETVKTEITEKICNFIDTIAKVRGLKASHLVTTDDLPRRSDPKLISAVEQCCACRNVPYHNMISNAYHDSLLIAEFAPVAMIFVPSHNGISHDPAEYTAIEDIARGAEILADTLVKLANMERL